MIIKDLDERTYHADRETLSVSGAKLILDCPARFRYVMDNPVHKDAYDFGTVAHRLILGKGADFRAVDYDSWRTKAAQAERDEIRAEGLTPILLGDLEKAEALADTVKTHPVAGAILSRGEAEASLYGIHEETGIKLRGRADWITSKADGTPVVVDVKTCASARPDAIDRSMTEFKYAMQAAMYLDLMAQNERPGAEFWLIYVEKTAPHLVNVAPIEPTSTVIEWGRAMNDKAIRIYAECIKTNTWPGYPGHTPAIKPWAWDEAETEAA